MIRAVAVPLVVCLLSVIPLAQQPAFDAAVFRINRSGEDSSSVGQRPGGRYVMTNGPIYLLLMNAFRPQNREIIGAPSWVMSERYDFQATANAQTTSDDLRLMLRGILAERLKLQAHLEPRDQPAYFLVTARPDKRLGPQAGRTSRDCASLASADRAGAPRPELSSPSNGAPPCGIRTSTTDLIAGGVTMDILARNLGVPAGRPIFDRTGVEGYFDLTLRWANADAVASDAASFFTALQEQLGLKLESGQAPLQTLVIDHIERPSDN